MQSLARMHGGGEDGGGGGGGGGGGSGGGGSVIVVSDGEEAALNDDLRVGINEVEASYPKTLKSALLCPVRHMGLVQRLFKTRTLTGAAARIGCLLPKNIGLYTTGGVLGVPRVIDVICMGCERGLSCKYINTNKEGAVAHNFCYKEKDVPTPADCQGVSEYTAPPSYAFL